jgi:hypothetical protein
VELHPWRLFFDKSVCSRGCGIRCGLILPHGANFELVVRL